MSQPLFGTGLATLTPNLAGAVTPIVVAVLQDISLDYSAKIVDLIGGLQVAVDKAKADVKVSGKFKSGYFAGGLIAAILSGSTSAVGSQQPFYLAYHDVNVAGLMSSYGDLCARLLRQWQVDQKIDIPLVKAGEPLRLAIVSGHFFDHSVWTAITRGFCETWDRTWSPLS